MTKLVFHHDHQQLPPASNELLPVQMYGRTGKGRGDIFLIGNPIVKVIKRLGVEVPAQAMDFLSIAMAVTAADTFVRRSDSADGWTRQFSIQLPLNEPDRWFHLKQELEYTLHFLSGDLWDFDFLDDGYPPPVPYKAQDRYHLVKLYGLDCVCLFSGGLDSAIGAIDLIKEGRAPLLVSHTYKGDKSRQDMIAKALKGRCSRFAVNSHPVSVNGETDITMRTRSFTFLAFGAIGACAVQAINQLEFVDLVVPENGFISLNAPLTSRRIGSLSTRTTHPRFIEAIQKIFHAISIPCVITNPYQFKTKGEMIKKCLDRQILSSIVDNTVSCSHWKRKNQQCGICIPCVIRRAALHAGGVHEKKDYIFNDLSDVLSDNDRRDDLFAISIALLQRNKRNPGSWIAESGPLPQGQYEDFQNVFLHGLYEVENYLKEEGIF